MGAGSLGLGFCLTQTLPRLPAIFIPHQLWDGYWRQVQNSVGSGLVTPAKAGVQYGERWLLACGFPLSRE